MDTITKLTQELNSLNQALDTLEIALKKPKNEFIRDSVIKRFEFSFELAWKTMKIALFHLGIEANNPRTCIRLAGKEKFITDITKWLDYQDKRNLSSHVYYEPTAELVYQIADDFLIDARFLVKQIVKLIKS